MVKNKEFHAYLKNLRISALISQEEVASQLGYRSSQFISNWERGHSHPPLKVIPQLAKMYKVPPEEMYQWIENAIVKDLRSSLRRRFLKVMR